MQHMLQRLNGNKWRKTNSKKVKVNFLRWGCKKWRKKQILKKWKLVFWGEGVKNEENNKSKKVKVICLKNEEKNKF